MPRIARGLVDGSIYHILNRGNGKQEVFHKLKDYEAFEGLLKEAKAKHSVELFGYCFMPNHFHMVLRPYRADELSTMMQWLMTSHVRRYHRHYGTSGHVWQGRYKSFIVQENKYLLNVLRYSESNPVRAKLVSKAKEWSWSSHRERIGKTTSFLLDKIPIELPDNWEEIVNTPLIKSEQDILHQSVTRRAPYGKPLWQLRICKKLGLESTIRPIGRPPKK